MDLVNHQVVLIVNSLVQMVIVSQLVIIVMVLLNGAMLDGVQIVQMVQMNYLTNAAMLVHTQMIYVTLLQTVLI